jgi:hypothetical protein
VINLKKWFKVFEHNFTRHQTLLDTLFVPLLAKKARPFTLPALTAYACGRRRCG